MLGNYWEFRHGDYCSTTCEIKHDGRKQLRKLMYDHCRCYSCFRELKTINPPKPDWEFDERDYGWTLDENGDPTLEFYDQTHSRSAAVGFQFDTEYATKGEKQRGELVITSTICQACGNTDHSHHDPVLADRDAVGRLVSLLDQYDDVVFDAETLHREYKHSEDVELAVGEALHD
ncbi:hypothetical protein [Halorussus marinus]|uniref:hypothetical protein n=1 Tax=Halorussus marinus TaxID=2505976 RepID=UPI001ADCFB9A|nr:hypothetical protein [Halorussus marinus]